MVKSKIKNQKSKLPIKIQNFGFWIVILIFAFCILNLLMGCATYKFQRGKEPYDKGYVVSRDDYTILEYSMGKDNNVPKLELARERFKRRRRIVEHYYKKMGFIENRFKMTFWDPPVMFLKVIGGIFRLPSIAISDYKYEHNPKYREKIRKRVEEEDSREETRIMKLKDELNAFIQDDLAKETSATEQPTTEQLAVGKPEVKPQPEEGLFTKVTEEKIKPEEIKRKTLAEQPVAIIIAKPIKGFSPLAVRFYGNKSYAPKGKIVSYLWDFGDGDTSIEVNPLNTYWSGIFTPQYFTITLTIQDDQGNSAKATTTIQVLNK